jgi:hypothetical protein
MYIVRDIFYLKFGHFRDVKVLMDEAQAKKMFPENPHYRFLTDFTGHSYRVILESGYATLADFDKMMSGDSGNTNEKEWREWYMKFIPHVESSEREILKLHS